MRNRKGMAWASRQLAAQDRLESAMIVLDVRISNFHQWMVENMRSLTDDDTLMEAANLLEHAVNQIDAAQETLEDERGV